MCSNIINGLYVDDGGQGELPIIFLHSLGGNVGHFANQLKPIRQTGRAIAIDLRGHGQSQVTMDEAYMVEACMVEACTIDLLAQDVHDVVMALDIDRFVLAGHSMGGSTAVSYAGQYPQSVAGLLLLDPSGDSTQMAEADVQKYLSALASEAYSQLITEYWQQLLIYGTPDTTTTVMADLQNTPRETVIAIFKALFNYNPIPALNSYTGPRKTIVTPNNNLPFSLHNLVPNFPHQLITGTSHWLHMDKPDVINDIIDEFVASL